MGKRRKRHHQSKKKKQAPPPKENLVSSENRILKRKNENIIEPPTSDGDQNRGGGKRSKQIATQTSGVLVSKQEGPTTIYKTNDIINGQYRIIKLLGTGAFGEVYLAADIKQKNQEWALKIEKPGAHPGQLRNEFEIYQQIKGGIGIPEICMFADKTKRCPPMLVMESLGTSLKDMLQKCGGKFSLETTAMLAEQMFERIEYVHQHSYIHRDIKPENLLLGPLVDDENGKRCGDKLYLIDFGIAKPYRDIREEHISPDRRGRVGISGTIRYTSIHAHMNIQLSRRDDLETIAYVLIFFAKGRLPWQGQKEPNKAIKVGDIKLKTSAADLCKGLPEEFAKCVNYCRNLDFEAEPDYVYLRSLFRKVITDSTKSKGATFMYDWNLTKT